MVGILGSTKEQLAKNIYSKTEYKNKDREKDIKKDVKAEFNRIDVRGIRDDQEIWEAGMNTIDRYILQLKYSKGLWVSNEKLGVKDGKATLMKSENIYKGEAINYFIRARNQLVKKFNAVKGCKITSSDYNRQLIHEVSCDIDKAENDALKLIKLKLNPKQEQHNAIEKSSAITDNQGNIKVKDGEILRQKPMFTQNSKGILTFTDRSNQPKIHEALKGLFPKGKNYKYKIDYKGCTNQRIKERMTQLTGTGQCWISFDEKSGTYLLRDKNGNTIESRALIWEGVTLQRDELIQWDTYEKEEKRKANIGKIDATANSNITPENDPQLKEMVEDIPANLRIKLQARGNEDYRRFIIETEKRLGQIIRYGKKYGYELHSEPVTTLQIAKGLMEVHFIHSDTEVDIKVRENDDTKLANTLGRGLYDFIDKDHYESEYKTYLTTRIKKLWGGKFDELTLKDDLLNTEPNYNLDESEKLPIESLQSLTYGTKILKQFIENHRESEGDSRLDNDDRYLVTIKKEIENLEYTIETHRDTTKKEVLENVINESINKISKYWAAYWSIPNTNHEKQKIREVLLGSTKEAQIKALRKMAEGKRLLGDVTESSFLADEISMNGEEKKTNKIVIDPSTGKPVLDEQGNPVMESTIEGGLEVEDSKINEKFQNINKFLYADLVYNDQNVLVSPAKQIKIIDKLYNASGDTSGNGIISILIEENMLPNERRYDDDVKEKAKEIAKSLREKQNSINKISINDIKANEQREKRQLEMKEHKTEQDLQRLQALEYLEAHPDEANKIHQISLKKMQDELRYGEINNLVRSALASVFVDKGGGAKGKNGEIYNDIIGYGFWDLSDENAKIAGEILVEVVITVVVSVCTMGAGTLAVAGVLRGASMIARSARWVKLANNISKAVRLLNAGAKGWRVASAAGRTTQILGKGAALLIEGTTFNAASNVIHSAVKGTSLDALNLNPIAKENIQTAAFLGALSVSGKLTQGLMKLGGRTKLTINLSKGLEKAHLTAPAKFTTGLVGEMGSMLAAEQAINFTFGHDVIDPETGKPVVDPETGEVVTSRSLTLPTQQDLIQMVGMIIAFKTVKPGLWQKYEKKLNDGTLEICRSVKKNEILLRDPKTGKVEKIQDLIDAQHNNYKPTPEQYKLRNHNRRLERQSKHSTEYNKAREAISEIPENLRSDAMKKLLEYKDMIEVSSNDIKRIQREIGLKGAEVDGVFGPKSLSKLKEYINAKNKGSAAKERQQETNRKREELTRKKEMHEKRKPELERKKAELERKRQQLLRQREANWRSLDGQENGIGKLTDILKKGNIITIDGFKYQFTGIKNGKAEFVIDPAAKKSVQQSGKFFSEKVEVSSLEELLDSRFNLEPGQKRTNSGRYNKLNELINEKIEPLDRLENKIRNKKSDIARLEEEIARLERGNNTIAKNDYFEQHKNEIVGRNVRIDGVKYRAEHINGDGTLQFKEVDGNKNFTISSFKQLAEKGQVNGFSDGLLADGSPRRGSGELTKSEIDNHQTIRNLISGEKGYLESRNISETIKQKKLELQTSQRELKGLEAKLPASKARQNAIDEIARKGAEINKQLRQIESELGGINRELSETDRLISKYESELNGLEGEENTGNESRNRESGEQEPTRRTETSTTRAERTETEITEETLADEFDTKILSEGITINGDTYKLEYRENTTLNKNRKGEYVWTKNGEVLRSAKAETRTLPDNADGNWIRSEYNKLRQEYIRVKKTNRGTIGNNTRNQRAETITENNSESIESRLNKELQKIGNGGNYENVKLDWITKAQFETGVFIEGVHRRFKNLSLKPNTKLPKEFLRKMRDKLVDMKNKWGAKLSNYYKKLVDKYDKYLERKLAEKQEKIEIKKEEMERLEKERDQLREQEQQRRQREEQQKRQREEQQKRAGTEEIDVIEISGYQENIKTRDGGRFTGEIKDGELYKGKFTDKNGNEWYIDRTSKYPVLKYKDKILLDKIGNKESINVGELKWTHRTNFDILKQIIDSGTIGNNGDRGVQFWGGLGACYGEVAVIMKNSVMDLPPAPSNINRGHGNYDYFFSGNGAKDRNRSTFQRDASDFSFHRQAKGENSNIDVPYLSIGGKNGGNGNFAHQVGIEHIEAVMLPAHAKKYPGYSELVKRINEKGIKVIEVPTEENILDYAGGSIILAKDGRRGSFDEIIIQELAKRYPQIPTFEQQVVTYLIETGRIKESEIRGKDFAEIREEYIKMATENGFSRGGVRGGQYQNYSSQKNYTKEQQAYFKYIIETRVTKESQNYPNPQIKAEIVDEAA